MDDVCDEVAEARMPARELSFARASRMKDEILGFDWSATTLGPIAGWPAALRTVVSVMLDCALPMYLAWGPDYLQIYNDAYRRILGCRHPAVGRSARDVWPEIWTAAGATWSDAVAGGDVALDSLREAIRRNGFPRNTSFDFSYSPVPNDDGRPAGLLVTFVETTGLVSAERRARFQLALSDGLRGLHDPDEITGFTCTLLGSHLDARRVGYATIDGDVVDISLRGWRDAALPSVVGHRISIRALGEEVCAELRAGRTVRIDDVRADPRTAADSGVYEWLAAAGMLIVPLLRGGELIAAVAVSARRPRAWTDEEARLTEDAAERTRAAVERAIAEEALRRKVDGERAFLRENDRRKDEFLAMLAHELRNPLAPIATAARLLEDADDVARVREIGAVCSRQVAHMKNLVDDLLDVSRVTRGAITLDHEVLAIADVVASAVEQARPAIQSKRHRLAVRDDAPGAQVRGDRTRLVQVVANLLNNAAKYTPEGGHVEVAIATGEAGVIVTVADDGPGIPAVLLPHVFELFTQGERSPDRANGGLGLGLALARRLVELHSGSIEAESDPARGGSTLRVRLPVVTDVVRAQPEPAPQLAAAGCKRVLVVDDNEDAAALLGLLLESMGHETVACHSAAAAIETVRSRAFDLCILDIGLPGMDGYELVAALRGAPTLAATRFVALTGYGQPSDVRRALAAGFDRHLVKPLEVDALAELLR